MRALVACDRPAVRSFLTATVCRTLDSAEVTAVADRAAALSVTADWGPHVAVVDLGAPESELCQFCADLNSQGVRTVVAAAGADEALRLLQAGAVGITSPGEGVAGLTRTLRAVAHGDAHVPSPILGSVLDVLIRRPVPPGQPSGPVGRLSLREREVLALLGDGLGTVEIARRLHISPETAKTHIRHLMHKLGVRSRMEAAAVAADLAARGGGAP